MQNQIPGTAASSKNIRWKRKRPLVFIKGRPDAHAIHRKYAESIGAQQEFEDQVLRWHDIPDAAKTKRYASWILNALRLLLSSKTIFFTEGVRIPALLAKKLSIFKKKKIIALMADESLFFIYHGVYTKQVSWIQRIYLDNCDHLICIGGFQKQIADKIVRSKKVKIHQIFNGLPEARLIASFESQPDLNSSRLLFIGNGPGEWRAKYKGLDTMLEAVNRLCEYNGNIYFDIVGDWKKEVIDGFIPRFPGLIGKRVVFHGAVSDLEPFFSKSCIYLHCAYGDSFPTTVLEAASHGLIPIISYTTGTQEIVSGIDKSLIVEQNAAAIINKIEEVLGWPLEKKQITSAKSKQVMGNYTEEAALDVFTRLFTEIMDDDGKREN